MVNNLPVLGTIKDSDKVKLITELLRDEPAEKQRYIFVIEHFKASTSLGFMKFEVFSNEKTMFRFKIQMHILPVNNSALFSSFSAPQTPQFNWGSLEVGKKHYTVGLVDVEEEGIWKKIQTGINTCLEEGEVPFLSSLIPMR